MVVAISAKTPMQEAELLYSKRLCPTAKYIPFRSSSFHKIDFGLRPAFQSHQKNINHSIFYIKTLIAHQIRQDIMRNKFGVYWKCVSRIKLEGKPQTPGQLRSSESKNH
jgi:hypothetical protein